MSEIREPDNANTRAYRRFAELRAKHGAPVSDVYPTQYPPEEAGEQVGIDPPVSTTDHPQESVPAPGPLLNQSAPLKGIQGIDLAKRVVVVEGHGYALLDDEVSRVATFCLEVMGRELAKHIKTLGEGYGIAPPEDQPPVSKVQKDKKPK